MSNTKKIAVWGLGKHAIKRILPAIANVQGLQLLGVCSRNDSVVKECAESMNCNAWTRPEDMLKDQGLDIIYLATPIGLHAEQGRRVLLAGKHLWCEKPLTCNLLKSKDLVRISRKKGLTIAEGFMYLYHPQFKEIRNTVHTNHLGTIKEVSLKFGFPELKYPGFRYDSSLGGGAFWDVGSYSISAALNLFKNEMAVVKYVDLSHSEKYGVDLDGTIILDFSCGARVISTWHIGTSYKNEIDIWGENGSLYSDRFFSKVDNYIPNLNIRDKFGTLTIKKLEPVDQFVEMFNHFLRLLLSKKDAEQERKNIIQRAILMDNIAYFLSNKKIKSI
ncbi:Gfo/Idh/MocA family oxidoreductase [Alphaproteobacteria bacterium]|nr:Gfo/Idh/MocA family oxidoreductase [Alphaproteobacteria bacterium]